VPAGRPLRTFLFDLDGTLIDSIPLIMASFRHTMRTHLGGVPDDTVWRAGFGTPLRPQLRKFASDDEQAARMVDTYRAYTDAHHDRLTQSYAGIDGALGALRGANAQLAVVTSKTHALARRGLARCGLNEYFGVLIGADDVAQHKPHPAPVLAALDKLSADPRETVFIGDSPHDIEAGRAAGVQTGAALWGPFPRETLARASPHHWLAEPDGIAALAR
jgi:pyrophosphatase PpaX